MITDAELATYINMHNVLDDYHLCAFSNVLSIDALMLGPRFMFLIPRKEQAYARETDAILYSDSARLDLNNYNFSSRAVSR